MRSGNPALNSQVFSVEAAPAARAMTLEGTASKTLLLLGLLVIVASVSWSQAVANPNLAWGFVMAGAIAGLVTAMVTIFKPTASPISAPIYAVFEGVVLGAFSAVFEAMYPGIVVQAVLLTFGVMGTLLVVYRLGIIRATENFKLGVVAATGGIMLIYVIGWIMRMFGSGIPMIHESGWVGIGFSLFVVVIASLNLVLDFDFIETGVERGAPKYMEWYAAFGLLVTLIWLYIEILRLLSKLRDR
jgi:uncharacterized YccA/Bax inhibitor family protein